MSLGEVPNAIDDPQFRGLYSRGSPFTDGDPEGQIVPITGDLWEQRLALYDVQVGVDITRRQELGLHHTETRSVHRAMAVALEDDWADRHQSQMQQAYNRRTGPSANAELLKLLQLEHRISQAYALFSTQTFTFIV